MKVAKWLGLVLGWVLVEGPILSILGATGGFLAGAMLDEIPTLGKIGQNRSGTRGPADPKNDFVVSLLILATQVIKADGRVDKFEMAYIRTYLADHFGIEYITDYVTLIEQVLPQTFDTKKVCEQIRKHTNDDERLVMLQFLFGIANADFNISDTEVALLSQMASWLGIPPLDFMAVKAMYHQEVDSTYKILEIMPSASDEAVKSAYRKMAVKHHPDKMEHLGEGPRKMAEEKFLKIKEAYEQICAERGMKS